MTGYTFTVLVLSALIGLGQCGGGHGNSRDEDEGGSGLTIGQTAAIAIGGGVLLALIIIAIVAIVKKCKAKPAVKPDVDKRSTTVVTPLDSTANQLYDDLPPKYSLRDQGPSNEVYLPQYPQEKDKKLAA